MVTRMSVYANDIRSLFGENITIAAHLACELAKQCASSTAQKRVSRDSSLSVKDPIDCLLHRPCFNAWLKSSCLTSVLFAARTLLISYTSPGVASDKVE